MNARERFVAAIRDCHAHFRYIPDPPGIELAKTAQEFEADGGGDCEDGGLWIAIRRMKEILPEEGILYAAIGFVPEGRHFWLEFETRFSRLVGDWTSGYTGGLPEGWRREERFPWAGDHWERAQEGG